MAVDWGITLGAIGVALGTPALIMAVPPFVQMLWGRPKIRLAFDASMQEGSNLLICAIHNLRVRNKLLKKLGVMRSETYLTSTFDIREHGTNKIFASSFRARLYDSASHVQGLALAVRPPLPVCFTILEHDDKEAISHNHAPSEETTISLPAGEYFAEVKIAWGDGDGARVRRSFTIGPNKEITCWTYRQID